MFIFVILSLSLMPLPFWKTGNGVVNSENKLICCLALVLLKGETVRFLEFSNKLLNVTTRVNVYSF